MLKSLHNRNIQIGAYICYICMRSKRVQLLHRAPRALLCRDRFGMTALQVAAAGTARGVQGSFRECVWLLRGRFKGAVTIGAATTAAATSTRAGGSSGLRSGL